jgi:uncharacterized protein YndB with AHSA1/START domain
MDISNFKPATVYTIYIASTPEKIWEALTTAEFSRKYFFGLGVEAELKVGGAFVIRAPDGSVHIKGEVIECDRPRKLTITWNVNWPGLVDKLGITLVSYDIEPAGDAVRPDHDGVPRPADQRRHPLGWTSRLASDPLQPEEPVGDRRCAHRQDGTAAPHAGSAQAPRHRGAVERRDRHNGLSRF